MSATGGDDRLPDRVLVTEADRDLVVARLNDAVGKGALQLEEVEERLTEVYRAKTRADLASLTEDLPTPTPAPPKTSPLDGFRSTSFQMHLVCYVVVIAFLTGIWALGGGGRPFWPFYPAGGWGIGLALHYAAATKLMHEIERRRVRREVRGHRPERRAPRRAIAPSDRSTDRSTDRLAALERPSRRFVVAMFVDVVGSTRLNEAMGDEQWARERERYRKLVADCASAEGGWEVSAAGDGVLTRFESPASAVRSAVAIQRRLADLRAASFAPPVRIGIHSGDVVDEGDDIVGAVVNVASRVSDVAAQDEIVVTEHVADHAAGVDTVDRGLHQIKGVSQPRHLLGVDWR